MLLLPMDRQNQCLAEELYEPGHPVLLTFSRKAGKCHGGTLLDRFVRLD
jgi:hypothetical protein